MKKSLWIGPLVSIAGLITYFVVFVEFPSLRDSALLNLALVTIGTALSLVGVVHAWRSGNARVVGALGMAISLTSAALLYSYVFAISYWLPEPTETALTLESIPEITLLDQHGEEVAIHERDGKRLLLTFYRGHW